MWATESCFACEGGGSFECSEGPESALRFLFTERYQRGDKSPVSRQTERNASEENLQQLCNPRQ